MSAPTSVDPQAQPYPRFNPFVRHSTSKHQLPDRDWVLVAGESTPFIANRFHLLPVDAQF
jgi:hypothetical protein